MNALWNRHRLALWIAVPILALALIAAGPNLGRGAEPGYVPFQRLFEYDFRPDQLGGGESFQVPDGYRLVIEFVSGQAFTRVGNIASVTVFTTVGEETAKHRLVLHPQGPAGGFGESYTAAQAMRVYADPGTTVTLHVNRSLGGDGSVSAALSGHLERVPVS